EIRSFFVMPGFTKGIYVAGGDVNGDGHADIIVGTDAVSASDTSALGGRVMVYDGVTSAPIRDFTVFDRSFMGGVRVASGDVDGDGSSDIVVGSGFGATPHIKVFSGQTNGLIRSFLAYDAAFQGGVFVAVANLNNDRFAEIVTSAGTNGHVKA